MIRQKNLLRALVAGCFVSALGQQQGIDFSIPSEYTSWDNENWVLKTDQLIQGQYQSRAPMGNGYIGCALGAVGPFFEADVNFTHPDGGNLPTNGWPLFNARQTFCTVSGFFNSQMNTTGTNFPELLEKGGESVIAGLPNWPNLILQAGDTTLDAAVDATTISNFSSTRSLKNGLQQWNYTWTPSSGIHIEIQYSMFMDRSQPNTAAIQLTARSSADANVTITDLLDGRGAVRSDPHATGMLDNSTTIYSAVSPHWLGNITAWVFSTVESEAFNISSRTNASSAFYMPSNQTTMGQSWALTMTAGTPITITKYIGVASSDGFDDPETVARDASLDAASTGYNALFTRSQAAWSELIAEELVDDYTLPNGSLPNDVNVVNMQIISKANAHYLLQNLLPSNLTDLAHWSISVGGLQSDSYAGLVFWDADTFMSPGIAVSHPSYAVQIPNYRAMLKPQAAINAETNHFSDEAIIYPWTSGRFGNCTGTGPCVDYQYHINNDIFLNNVMYWRITGDDSFFRDVGIPINTAVLHMFSELVEFNSSSDGYSISNMTDPDEYANQVPDGAYTLAAIAKDIQLAEEYSKQFGLQVPSNWSDISEMPALPFASSGILSEYRGANNSAVIKQDDVDLIHYPLDYTTTNYTEANQLTSLDYYANLQSPDGPAMTYSLYSISANDLSPSGCSAYTYALNGFQPYARAPWYQFSEQQVDDPDTNGGTNPAFPFMTGAGGWHQVGPMGWLGARVIESQFFINPSLPPQIPFVSLRTIFYGGTGIKASMNYTHTVLTRVDVSSSLPINSTDVYANRSMPFTVGVSISSGYNMTISLGQTLTISNRMYSDNVTAPGNLVQCLPVTTTSSWRPGQFPLAAIDGAASTKWQPTARNASSLTIDTTHVNPQLLSGVSFDWGSRPATSAKVTIYNATSALSNDTSTREQVTTFDNITISAPYDPSTDAIIRPYVGNMSFFSFSEEFYSGDYVTLTIEGCLEEGDMLAATVAEFNLFGVNGTTLLGQAQDGAVNATGGQESSVSVGTVTAEATSGAVSAVATAGLTGASGTGSGSSQTGTAMSSEAGRAVGKVDIALVLSGLALIGFVFAAL